MNSLIKLVILLLAHCLVAYSVETGTCANPDCEGLRVITEDELKTMNGRDGSAIWLSLLGEVYDVTEGGKYYGEGKSYGFFAAKDASVCFATGKFNEEGLKEKLEDLSDSQLQAVDDWRKFYAEKDNYHFVGVLEGTFYDTLGKPTERLNNIVSRLKSQK